MNSLGLKAWRTSIKWVSHERYPALHLLGLAVTWVRTQRLYIKAQQLLLLFQREARMSSIKNKTGRIVIAALSPIVPLTVFWQHAVTGHLTMPSLGGFLIGLLGGSFSGLGYGLWIRLRRTARRTAKVWRWVALLISPLIAPIVILLIQFILLPRDVAVQIGLGYFIGSCTTVFPLLAIAALFDNVQSNREQGGSPT